MIPRLAALTLLAGGLAAASAGHAQNRPTAPPAGDARPKVERAVYPVKGGDPVALAEVIGKHFPGEVEASAVAGSLVLSGPPESVAEATKLLGRVDRRARTVELVVTLVEVSGKDVDLPDGPVDRARADELVKAGGSVQRVRLTADEGQPVSLQSGTDKPMLTTSVIRPAAFPGPDGGPAKRPGAAPAGAVAQRSINYRPVGTTVKATPQVGADGSVAVDLSVQDSSVRAAAADDETGSPAFDTATLTTRLTVPAGRAVVAQATRKDAKDGRSVTLVVVTAKVIEAAPGG